MLGFETTFVGLFTFTLPETLFVIVLFWILVFLIKVSFGLILFVVDILGGLINNNMPDVTIAPLITNAGLLIFPLN